METDPSERHVPLPPVQFASGFRLLDKFKAQWECLHRYSESNVSKVQSTVQKLETIEKSCSRQLEALQAFSTGFKSLARLDEQIVSIQNDFAALEATIVKIEESLIQMTQEKEKRDFEKYIRSIEGNHEALMQREKIESELRRDRLMSEHLKRVQKFEEEQQRELEERRVVLERQFEEEKKQYLNKK